MTIRTGERILHIITGLNDGGAEAMLYRLVTSDQGHEHVVISLSGLGKYGALLQPAGIKVFALGLSSRLPAPWKLVRLVFMIRALRPDVVQTWMYHADLLGGLAARIAGCHRVVWGLHHTTLDKKGTKWMTYGVVKLNALVSRIIPARIISCSKSGVSIHQGYGYARERITIVHNGHDTDAFMPDPKARQHIRSTFGIKGSDPLIGCVARFNPQKDHKNLLQAFALFLKHEPAARLMLVGPGMHDDNCALMEVIDALAIGHRVILCGPRHDIADIMNGLDVFVLASAFGEAFPNVLCEAMSCGTACISTDVGDSAYIIGETGRICPPKDAQALFLQLVWMFDADHMQNLARACRHRICAHFSLARMIDGYSKAWAKTGDRT